MKINRLLQVIIYLMSNKNTTVRQLSERFDVSRKTIYRDLEVLITSGIPVVYGEDMSGYVEILEGFDIFNAFKNSSKDKQISDEARAFKRYVNNDAYVEKVGLIWDAFTKNMRPNVTELREEILYSWIRCQKNGVSTHEVDPSNLLIPEDVAKYDIVNAMGKDNPNAILFSNVLKEINWYGCICDKNGRLKYLINPMKDYDVIYPQVGYNIDADESIIGTNGVSVAIEENKVAMVLGTEHYNKSFHQVTCVAAPLYKDEELDGVLNISFVHTSVNEQVKQIVYSLARFYEVLVLKNTHLREIEKSEPIKDPDMAYVKNEIRLPSLLGESLHMRRVKAMADAMATVDSPMSIVGESGVGKTTFARYVHSSSNRKYGPCNELDCSTIENNDFKEKFFGSEITGSEMLGLIEESEGGSLIIKNVSLLPKSIQEELARFLSEGRLKRKGSKKWREYDVRLFTVVYPHEIRKFEERLSEELSNVQVKIKPLRERKKDIAIMATHCFNQMKKSNKSSNRSIIEIIKMLERNELKGNTKELYSLIEDYCV